MRSARVYLWAAISILAIICIGFRGNATAPVNTSVAEAAIAGREEWDSNLQEKEEETIRKSFTLTGDAAQRVLEVDNVTGSIEVVGNQSDQVQLVVNKVTRAESKAKLEKARKEVTLDVTQDGGSLKLFVNGPFRCSHDCDCGNFHDDYGYQVRMDFQLQVPRNIELKLRTVNGGRIQVKDVTGNYSVNNVNGGIDMQNVAGSGKAHTVNGGVKVVFRENPRENSSFGSINGPIELYFAKNLSADFRFKTMNGGVFSDFPMTMLPNREAHGERQNGRFIFHADRFTGGRVGSGGPEITAQNLNGSIRVLERQD